jgi:hypothetical protein
MIIQTFPRFISYAGRYQKQAVKLKDYVQATSRMASYVLQKSNQAAATFLPTEITQNSSIHSIVDQIKSSVSSISGGQHCVLFGLTWISRKIPLIRRVSFVFEIAILASVLHTFKRIEQSNIKSAEENRKFRESNQKAQQLTIQDQATIANTVEIVEDNSKFVTNNQKAKQISDQNKSVIARQIQIINQLKSPQHLNVSSIKKLALIAKQLPQKQAEKIASQQRSKKIDKVNNCSPVKKRITPIAAMLIV